VRGRLQRDEVGGRLDHIAAGPRRKVIAEAADEEEPAVVVTVR
jgi:hypothetical protein